MTAVGRQRLDKWLFFARVVKSRSLSAKLAQAGRIRINQVKTDNAAHAVKPGDVLTITLDRQLLVYQIVDCGSRRGPAEEARRLYDDISPKPLPREAISATGALPEREAGSGRPTKKERRATDRLRDPG
ncbi:RNA-binding S4 domain-containing protein [Mesorhizobium sp. NBSH29]|uniref:RNA-binding S4 domain-containing protein n=1 Tax=Mesorhizobium sp. NBSH29 TaxID=2654249 RepID=UPI001896916F|nr:RNA-binding S4 domain-containing protein [Mesorhizobium sp. NBSH29]QPC85939.1 RNA-binding S4 domain-containing protein [Mesorhizobium sp. NBSH29]